MAALLDTVQRWRKLEEVTGGKDESMPAYLMEEISQLAKATVENSDGIAEHLKKRLCNNSPIIKWKVWLVSQISSATLQPPGF